MVPGYYYSLPFLDPDEIRLEVNHVPGKGVFAAARHSTRLRTTHWQGRRAS